MKVMTRLAIAFVFGALLLATGCAQGSKVAPEVSTGPSAGDAAAVFEQMHPGFSAEETTEDGEGWLVTARSDDVPAFWIRGWVAPVPGGDLTVTVDGVEWSSEMSLQEVTENAGLMPGDMRQQFMRAVVDYVDASDAEHPGGFVTSVSVISNMDMQVGYTSDTGDLNMLDFKLDLASGDWIPAD